MFVNKPQMHGSPGRSCHKNWELYMMWPGDTSVPLVENPSCHCPFVHCSSFKHIGVGLLLPSCLLLIVLSALHRQSYVSLSLSLCFNIIVVLRIFHSVQTRETRLVRSIFVGRKFGLWLLPNSSKLGTFEVLSVKCSLNTQLFPVSGNRCN